MKIRLVLLAIFIGIITLLSTCAKQDPFEDNGLRTSIEIYHTILDNCNEISKDDITIYQIDSALKSVNYKTGGVEVIPMWNNHSQDAHNQMESAISKRLRYTTIDLLDLLSVYGQNSLWDLSNNGLVDVPDILLFLSKYGASNTAIAGYSGYDSIKWVYNDSVIFSGDLLLFKTLSDTIGWFPPHQGILNIGCKVYDGENVYLRYGYSYFTSSDGLYDNVPYISEDGVVDEDILYTPPFKPFEYLISN